MRGVGLFCLIFLSPSPLMTVTTPDMKLSRQSDIEIVFFLAPRREEMADTRNEI